MATSAAAAAIGCHAFRSELSTPADATANSRRSTEGPRTEITNSAGVHIDIEESIAAAVELEQQGSLKQAIGAYQRIAREHPPSARVYQRLAVLSDKVNQSDQSARYYLAALKLAPENAEILCDFGYSRYLQGDLALAEQSLRRALAADPELARAHNNLGLVLARNGKKDEALAEFSRAGCNASQARRNLAYALMPSEQSK